MSDPSFSNLLSPIRLGPLKLPHRVIISGHSMLMEDPNGLVGRRYIDYLAERAKGGAALVTMGSAPVHPQSIQAAPHTWLWKDEVIDGLSKAADAVHQAGSKLSIILWHGGHNLSHHLGIVPVAPSAIPSPQTGEIPKPLTVEEIGELVGAYASAAQRCADAGLDAVELQTSSNYLLGSFLSPHLNRRTDEYGGSLENRTRFPIEILDAIRAKVGETIAVGVRTSAEHLIPHDPDGYSLDDAIEAMELISARARCDWVSVMTGSHWAFEEMISTMDYPRAQLADQSRAFKRRLGVPVIVAGRIRSPAEAEAIIATESADLVAMARSFIADPNWMTKVQRGEADRIRPCMSCNQACLGNAFRGQPGSCVINPRAGREFELPAVTQRKRSRHVAVVGGGPAGLELSRVAAKRGHQVTLYERENRLGGALALLASAPHRGEMKAPIDWWQSELELLGVDIRLGQAVTTPSEADAEVIVWATGAKPGLSGIWRNRPQLVNGIPGTEHCLHSREVLAGNHELSGDVLIIDEESGWPAVATAESLALNPAVSSVTVTTDRLLLGLPALQFSVEISRVTRRLAKSGIQTVTGTLIASVSGGFATTTSGDRLGPFDHIVLSAGPEANPVPDGVLSVGDCVTPRTIWAAVTEGMELGRSI